MIEEFSLLPSRIFLLFLLQNRCIAIFRDKIGLPTGFALGLTGGFSYLCFAFIFLNFLLLGETKKSANLSKLFFSSNMNASGSTNIGASEFEFFIEKIAKNHDPFSGRVAIQSIEASNLKDNFTFKCHRSPDLINGFQEIYAVNISWLAFNN